MESLIDCSLSEGEKVFSGDGIPLLMREGISFAQWIEDWVIGVDLFEAAYRAYQRHRE